MDRQMVYPGQIPLETDLLNSNKYALIGLSKLAAAVLGTNTLLNGLACAPVSPAALQVQIGAGEIYSVQNIDNTAYSSLAADTAHPIVKQGVLLDAATLDCPAPAASGQSVDYLVQAAYLDQDSGAVALPYYNASNPAQAYSGPNNSGAAQATVRQGECQITVKPGVAAASGSQTPPIPDAGYTGAYVVTVANGQTAITTADISVYAGAPFITETLTEKLSQATADGRYVQPAQIQSGALLYGVDSGAANAYAISLTPAVTALAAGQAVTFLAASANTGAATLAVNGLPPAAIGRNDGSPLAAGDIPAGGMAAVVYDGAQFQLANVNGLPLSGGALTGPLTLAADPATALEAASKGYVDRKGNAHDLTQLLYPSQDGGWRDIYRAGWKPAWFNQQWGGAQWGQLPDGRWGDVATGYIEDSGGAANVGDAAATTYWASGFKTSAAMNLAAAWLKLYKVGNPANNLQVSLYTDNAGVPGVLVTNGAATAQSGKLHATDAAWYRFVFPISPSVSANTRYWLVVSSSGVVDAANYWVMRQGNPSKYPHGFVAAGDATPVWTASTAACGIFLIEAAAAGQFLQGGGVFDAKLVFNEGAPLDQSQGLTQPLRHFFDGRHFTDLVRGSGWSKGKTLRDYLYGLDHDRIALSTDATSGVAIVTLYDKAGVAHSVSGVSDVTAPSHQDIAVTARLAGDGADMLALYVNGVLEGSLMAQTFVMDARLRDLGSAWIGGGFPLAPAWTQTLDMSVLPSAAGWTWSGTGVEANCMSVSGGKLYQNANGYGALDTGYYGNSIALSNAAGWMAAVKFRVPSSTNNTGAAGQFQIYDGAKQLAVYLGEYFINLNGGAVNSNIQVDLQSREHVLVLCGKGSDFYGFLDGRLICDGTGGLTMAATSSAIDFGDLSAASGENSSIVWDYVKCLNSAPSLPQFHSGASLAEFAHWSGDQSPLLPSVYNGGAAVSVKRYCGVERNYVERIGDALARRGVVANPSTTSTVPVLLPEMEAYFLGEVADVLCVGSFGNNTLDYYSYLALFVDGASQPDTLSQFCSAYAAATGPCVSQKHLRITPGLHKVEGRTWCNAYTSTNHERNLRIISK